MNWILDMASLGALLSAIMVITVKNPVISVIFLIAVFINITLYLITIGLGYLGLVYLIVYIGAIAILFLFVIMMLNLRLVEMVETGQQFTKSLPIAVFIGSFFIYIFITILPETYHDGGSFLNTFNNLNDFILNTDSSFLNQSSVLNNAFNSSLSELTFIQFSQIETIGNILYTNGAIWLIITAIILMLAMVGPILLCLRTD